MEIYDEVFSFSNLIQSECKARRNKRHKKDVIDFELDLGSNIFSLYKKLKERTYKVSGYNRFKIYEPKERSIQSLHYFDRVVQHCLVDYYLTPLLDKRLIYSNAACRKNKGTDFARNLLKRYLLDANKKGKVYILQFDIHHYFEEINHDILKSKLNKLVKDDEMLLFLYKLIDSFNEDTRKGLPMGNQTSQCFALYYLDNIDRLIKEKYRIRGYVRYMDDGIVISNDKSLLHEVLLDLRKEVSKLKLELNTNKTHIFPFSQGVTFLGFKFKLGNNGSIYLRLAKGKKKRIRRHLDSLKGKRRMDAINSYKAHLSKGKEYKFRKWISKLED